MFKMIAEELTQLGKDMGQMSPDLAKRIDVNTRCDLVY
jgi:hypothetical protein